MQSGPDYNYPGHPSTATVSYTSNMCQHEMFNCLALYVGVLSPQGCRTLGLNMATWVSIFRNPEGVPQARTPQALPKLPKAP